MRSPRQGPLCADARLLGLEGSGVATYAAALRGAQRSLDPASRLLADRTSTLHRDPADGRARRWLAALWPGARRAAAGRLAGGEEAFIGRDIFRLAAVWFDVHRKLMPVSVPGPPGVMHWSYPLPLRLVGWSNLYTVHDVIPLTASSLSPIGARRHGRLLRCIALSAECLVTVSTAARDEIATTLRLDPARIVDCGEAVTQLEPLAPLPAGLKQNGYLLVVGTIEPRKNIARIIEGWRQSTPALPLVLAGRDGWRSGEIALPAIPGLIRLPDVTGAMLATLLAHARALLMPSLAEGFGLPVIEAMAAGTPVITSRGGALEEIAGAAALLVDPLSSEAIAAAIRRILGDDMLAVRLAEAGRARALHYTPERFAGRLAALYQQMREETRA